MRGSSRSFTYIAPMLTTITGFPKLAVSPILLMFGGGLVAGNLVGGRLADWRLVPTVLGTLAVLAAVLGFISIALHDRIAAVVSIGLLGAAGFATVAPLQMWVLEQAQGVGESLASSFNIAAFNLGNALGAWVGGMVIDRGMGTGRRPDRTRLRVGADAAGPGPRAWRSDLESARLGTADRQDPARRANPQRQPLA